jgi:hypothetical protein
MKRLHTLLALSIAIPSFVSGCASEATSLDEAIAETGVDGPFEYIPEGDGKHDGNTARGPRVAPGTSTEVWAVTRNWDDVEAEPGIAWEEGSGLDWEQKYDAWIASFELEPRLDGYGDTFIMTTPYGDRSFHAPTLECAEVGMLLRATFASWYHLPFYLSGWSSQLRAPIYAGHFGFVDGNGSRVENFPSFRTRYRDYEGSWSEGDEWPSDSVLRRRRLGDDDRIEFLSDDDKSVGAGAYFDEIFLNKRVGHFMRLLLLFFYSGSLADSANVFHVQPEAVAPGDLLMHRWQRRGVGHTMPIFRVERLAEDALQVSFAYGNMPRAEPRWQAPNVARSSFLSNFGGGVGENSEGDSYVSLGGGLRRWRTAVFRDGRWVNDVRPADRDVFISDADEEAVSARPARFDEILRTLTPEERRDSALAQIETMREHLRSYPASCSARINRENAFEDLYEVMTSELGYTRAQVDAEFRTLEDYVFAELEYESSRTCCWNRSTAAMHGIIMSYAEAEQTEAEAAGMCAMPTVFRAESDGYARWADYAESIGKGNEWNPWEENESCDQRDVPEDTIATGRDIADYCSLGEAPPTPEEPICDPEGGDDTMESAQPLTAEMDAQLCEGDTSDWYAVEGDATVVITFDNDDGDLDMEAYDEAGEVIDSSYTVGDEESVNGTGTFYVKVYGYRGATNSYRIAVSAP